MEALPSGPDPGKTLDSFLNSVKMESTVSETRLRGKPTVSDLTAAHELFPQ